jgi:prevent-host-death family protein
MTTTVNIHEAKTHLSRLVEQAAQGHEFVIAKAGKPMVRVVPIEAPPTKRRLGTMAGQGTLELDLKKGFEADINQVFGLAP